MGFRFRCPPSADDPNAIVAPVGMSQKQNATLARRPGRDESLLGERVIRVIERERGEISEHGGALGEGHLVFLEIGRRFLGIPLVDHDLILRPSDSKSTAVDCPTFGISGGAKRRPLHAVVGRHVVHAILRRYE
jgi:hypothetical protein